MNDFMTGCNYWASNAGMLMWRHFDKKVVENDLKLLSEHGADTIRVFPLWCDFQPVENTFTRAQFSYRMKNFPVENKEILDESQMNNFSFLLDVAEKFNLRVIVSLVTGWMSGRLFAPAFLLGKNLLTDPEAVLWECGFIRAFVSAFRNRKCIVAWEPGNECNCLNYEVDAAHAELWLMTITDAIRAADSSRPVYAGMHGLSCNNTWNIPMVARYTDMQTTHPYPLFTPYCQTEEITSMRAALHAAAESSFYASVADQRCLVEEIGTLGPMIIGENYAPEYLEKAYVSSLQYGASGFLWWCAFDQDKFDFPPYDVITVERNLGLAYSDGKPKPVLEKLKETKEKLSPLSELYPQKHAIVILSEGDNWKTAYGAFLLAVQAGYTVEFMYETQPLKDASRYILPCIAGTAGIPKPLLTALKEKVAAGAELLITYDGGHIGDFEKLTGLTVKGRSLGNIAEISLDGKKLSLRASYRLQTEAITAKILSADDYGISLSENNFEKGKVFFLNAPLENDYTDRVYPCDTNLYEIYSLFFRGIVRPIEIESKYVAVTYYPLSERKTGVFVTNYSKTSTAKYVLPANCEITECRYANISDSNIRFDSCYAYLVIEWKT